jgi:heme/copper-type cytochrome/quinol oxidase subunit 2
MTGKRGRARAGRFRLAWAAGLAVPLLSSCAKTGITSKAHQVHDLYRVIFTLALPVFVAVWGLLLWNVLRYRKRDDSPAPQRVGGPVTIAGFFLIGAVIIAVLYPFGERTLARVDALQKNAQVNLKLEGFQWEWTAYYQNEGLVVSGKTLKQPLVFELPVDEPVRIQLVSRDVMHEFFLPDLLFMRNAIPGHPNVFTFTPTKIGTFNGQCAQFCGLWHSRMTFVLKVVSPADYVDWVKKERRAVFLLNCPTTNQVTIVAKNISWNTNCLAVPTGSVPLTVTNDDAGINHNFAIWDSPLQKTQYFQTGKFSGVATDHSNIPSLPPGKYYFQCNVHGPAMSGVYIVRKGSS